MAVELWTLLLTLTQSIVPGIGRAIVELVTLICIVVYVGRPEQVAGARGVDKEAEQAPRLLRFVVQVGRSFQPFLLHGCCLLVASFGIVVHLELWFERSPRCNESWSKWKICEVQGPLWNWDWRARSLLGRQLLPAGDTREANSVEANNQCLFSQKSQTAMA